MKTISMNEGWKFSYSSGTAALDAKGASYKKNVNLPHDFMISTERTADARTEGAGGFFQGGIGTYERTFTVSEDRTYYLLFEGSYGNTEVWINGNLAALHHYGYTEFYTDITRWLKYGEDNKLKVVVENNALPGSRWYSGAGLYRKVWLMEADSVYMEPWSVAVDTQSAERIHVNAEITNKGAEADIPVRLEILDAAGNVVCEENRSLLCAFGKTTCDFTIEETGLKLWSPDHPVLYTAKMTAGTDEKAVTFGVRTLKFSREGFFLNGEYIKLKGGCLHHDNGIAGSCAYEALEERKIRLLKESGYNAIRTSHNPMSTALLDACDRLGMLVLDECFDCWRAKKNPFDYHLYFEKEWQQDLSSMVLRDRNHPSVIMYSIGNEIGERDGSGDGAAISRSMVSLVHQLDNTRAVTNGICAVFLDAGEFGGILANIFGSGGEIDFSTLPPEVLGFLKQADYVTEHWGEITAPFAADLDVVGYNYLDARYAKDGRSFPDRIIVGTESYPKDMKNVWANTMAQDYVLGDFTWTAIDYLGESGIGHASYDEASGLFCDYPFHTGNCGDYDLCGFLRPQGKFRRLLWDAESAPVVSILKPEHFGKKEAISSWGWADVQESWTHPGYEEKKVRVDIYSKAEEVGISVNGKEEQRFSMPDTWILQTDLDYEPGQITVTNYTNGLAAESTTLTTAGAVQSLQLTKIKTLADDVSIFRLEAVDAAGQRNPTVSDTLSCALTDAELVGFGGADPVSADNYAAGRCHLYEGRALLIIRKTADTAGIAIQDTDRGLKVECKV